MMQILVTGGAGYIGSHTAKALAANGILPIVLDNLSTGHALSVQWGPLVRGDVGDRQVVRQVLRDYRIDGAIHFAASAYVGESMDHPRTYFHNNVVNTLSFFEELLDANVRNVVFSSTCATYGIPSELPISELHRQSPVNPYGESKLFIERALAAFESAYGMNSVVLRYFNAAGADPDNEIGELHDPETHLIPLAIGAALGRRAALEVFGTDYPTLDGTAVRDFIHVSDLAIAHVRALEYLINEGKSVALNLGTGRGYSVQEIVAAVEKFGGMDVPVRLCDRRAGDPPALVAEASLARQTLGWEPQYAELRDMIGTAWAWHNRVDAKSFLTSVLAHHG